MQSTAFPSYPYTTGYACTNCGVWVTSNGHTCLSNAWGGGYTYTLTPVDPEAIARRVVDLLKAEGVQIASAAVSSRDVGAE